MCDKQDRKTFSVALFCSDRKTKNKKRKTNAKLANAHTGFLLLVLLKSTEQAVVQRRVIIGDFEKKC